MNAPTTVALIHGLGCSRRAWQHVTPLLEERGLRVAAIELPGYGLQRGRTPERTVPGMAAAIEPEIAALGDQTVVVGHSLGGLVATALAERAPHWLQHVTLINSSLTAASRLTARSGSEGLIRRPLLGRLAWRIAPRGKLRAGLESAFAPGFAVPDLFVDDLQSCSWAAFTRSSAAIDDYLDDRALADRLDAVRIPSTLIFGMQDRRIDPAAIAAITASRPESVVEIPASGHTPQWETPAAAAEAIAGAAGVTRMPR